MAGQRHMADRAIRGLSVIHPNNDTEAAEARLANSVVAMDVNPNTANVTVRDIDLAIRVQFGSDALPIAITRFCSDFVIQFATPHERNLVVDSMVLKGQGFDTLLVAWSNHYGGQTIDWDTEVAIDIEGFPPHTFTPTALAPLLERHCSIQTYNFSEPRGACRVNAYAHNTRSVPRSGEIALQYPNTHGVSNIVFPVSMTTYPYLEAPEFPGNDFAADSAHSSPNGSVGTYGTAEQLTYDAEVLQKAYERQYRDEQMGYDTEVLHEAYERQYKEEEMGYDTEVLQEAYEREYRANDELDRARYPGHAPGGTMTSTTSSDEPFYIIRDSSPTNSLESDRSWRLY